MANVKVFNLNTYDFKSQFKGDSVFIKAQDYWRDEKGEPKIMDLYEATDFKGTYHPIMKGADDQPDPKYFKMIRLEKIGDENPVEIQSHVCMQCKHKSPSAHELDAHIKFTHAEAPMTSIPEEDAKPKKKTA